jgi:hypothetical protein
MSVIGSNILAGASGQGGAYNLTNSLRFRSSASAYLNRTPASSTNRTTWTWSAWVKRGELNTADCLLGSGTNVNAGNGVTEIGFSSDQFFTWTYLSGVVWFVQSTQVFRDPSAWYHFVVAVDTTQATASNRVKMYVNGSQITALATATYPTQNYNTGFNSTDAHNIGRRPDNSNLLDSYLAEVNFVDGLALTPSSFGETSSTTGVWIPKKYTGTYGTNGFYLPFTDNSALTTSSNAGLGKDFSGNSNYWTTNNISITSGSTYDSMTDVPTLTSATVANYCVYNPLNKFSSTTITNGNLLVTNGSSGDGWSTTGSTFAFPQTGKWYAEFTIVNRPFSGTTGIGIVPSNISFVNQSGDSARFAWGRVYFDNSGIIGPNNASVQNTSQAPTYTTGDIISVAFDSDNGTVWWAKNGTWTNSGNPATGTNPAYSGLTATAYPMGFVITSEGYSSSQISGNWGQLPFAYTPPTGFVRLNTFNLP